MKLESSDKLQVLFLPRWYPHRYDPMFGLFVERHGLAISSQADVSVLFIYGDVDLKTKTYEVIQDIGILFTTRIYYKKSKLKPALLAHLVNLYRFLWSHWIGFKQIRETGRKPDLLHVHVLTRLGMIAWLYKIFTRTPYVITEHWSRYLDYTDGFKGFFRKKATRRVVRQSAAVSVVSHNLGAAMKKHNLNHPRYFVINNVVDTDLFRMKEQVEPPVIVNFIHVSCIEDRSKNISGLLRVVARLQALRNDFKLTIVGTGQDMEAIRTLAKDLNLKNRHLQFTGMLEGKAIVEAYQKAQFMVMFSNYENMPVVIGEAFACGLPVLTTNVGGISEHVNPDRGILVSPQDEAAMLEKLTFMIDNYSDFDRRAIRKYAVEQFSTEAVAGQIEKIYSFAIQK